MTAASPDEPTRLYEVRVNGSTTTRSMTLAQRDALGRVYQQLGKDYVIVPVIEPRPGTGERR